MLKLIIHITKIFWMKWIPIGKWGKNKKQANMFCFKISLVWVCLKNLHKNYSFWSWKNNIFVLVTFLLLLMLIATFFLFFMYFWLILVIIVQKNLIQGDYYLMGKRNMLILIVIRICIVQIFPQTALLYCCMLKTWEINMLNYVAM